MQIPLAQLHERNNYRQTYDTDFVSSLAGDIAANGFKQEYPITVYLESIGDTFSDTWDDRYIIIDGHTRYHAALLASTYSLKDRTPLLWVKVVVKDKPGDSDFKLQQLAANEQRRDPDDMSKATGYQQALDAGATLDQLVAAIGRTRQYVEDRVKLLALIPDARELVAHKQIGIRYALCMVDLDTNFQHIALRAYNEGKAHSVDTFNAVCSALLEKQRTCSLFDMALFNGKPIEQVIDIPQLPKEPSKAELMAQLIAERHAHATHVDQARRTVKSLKTELSILRAQLDEMRIPA